MNKNYRKRRPFFKGKSCQICKRREARMFRLIKNKKYMLCDSKECEKITRIRAGYFDSVFSEIKITKTKVKRI